MNSIYMLVSNPYEPDPRVYKEARSLAGAGFAVTILAWDRQARFPEQETLDGVRIRRIRTRGQYGARLAALRHFAAFYREALAILKRERPDAVHCHDLDMAPLGWLARRLGWTDHFIYDAHEPDYYGYFPRPLKWLFDRLERFLARRADGVMITNRVQERKFAEMGVRTCVMLRNVPPTSVQSLPPPELPIAGEPIIGRIGFITAGLGLEQLMQAVEVLSDRYPDIRVVLVGKVHPHYQAEFDHLRQRYRDRLFYPGFLPFPDALAYYHHFTLSFNLYEPNAHYRLGTPTKLYESMAFGVPVLVSPIGDVEEILNNAPCGMILPDMKPGTIRQAIETMLSYKSQFERFKKAALDGFEQYYHWKLMEKRLLDFYRSSFKTGERAHNGFPACKSGQNS